MVVIVLASAVDCAEQYEFISEVKLAQSAVHVIEHCDSQSLPEEELGDADDDSAAADVTNVVCELVSLELMTALDEGTSLDDELAAELYMRLDDGTKVEVGIVLDELTMGYCEA